MDNAAQEKREGLSHLWRAASLRVGLTGLHFVSELVPSRALFWVVGIGARTLFVTHGVLGFPAETDLLPSNECRLSIPRSIPSAALACAQSQAQQVGRQAMIWREI